MQTRFQVGFVQGACRVDHTFRRTLLRPILGKKGFQLHEEAWNAYPYCKTVITNPGYMKENLQVVLETLHCPDNGTVDNVLNMPLEEYKKIGKPLVLDIVSERSHLCDESCNPATYSSVMAKRGPLDPKTWTRTTVPIMTCYKFITVNFKWFGIQNKMENAILEQYRRMLLAFHQQVWCWTDEWYGLTWSDIRKLEVEAEKILDNQLKTQGKRGTQDLDD